MSISTNIISRYSDRFKKFGYDTKTLGWGTEEQQIKRFQEFSKLISDLKSKVVIDIGCGFGDYYKFLGDEGCLKYIGLDINPDLINEANKIYKNFSNVEFLCKDLLFEKSTTPLGNIGVMIGVLNLNFHGEIKNFEFSKTLIENAFTYVDDVLLIDFISCYRTEKYQGRFYLLS